MKLNIRILLKSDISKEYLTTINHPETKKYIQFSKIGNTKKKTDLIDYINNLPKTDFLYGVFNKKKHLANFKFQKKGKKIYIGFLTFTKYQGNGIFVKVFSKIIKKFNLKYRNQKKIYLGVNPNNLKAKYLYKKLGFKKVKNSNTDMYFKISDKKI